jgi:hypothetical protein
MVVMGIFPALGLSATYTFNPVADAYINVGDDYNYGFTDLIVRSGSYSYVKFDLSTIPATEQITGGTFNAFCSAGSPVRNFAVQLRAVSDTSWTEWGITGGVGKYPALGSVIATYDTGRQGEYNQWTVGATYLPRGLVSYAMSLSAGSYAHYISRHNIVNQPYLQVTTVAKPKASAGILFLLLD